MFKRLSSFLFTAGLAAVIWQHQAIIDWWTLRSYQPPPEIAALSEQSQLTVEGRRLLYLGKPALNQKSEFAQNCPSGERQSLVLGCYRGGNIYVLKVERPELAAVMPVTAAHEMLHAVYDRLSEGKQERINNLIANFYPSLADPKLRELIAEYQRREPGELYNELHSLLGTQVAQLPPELEAYYRTYFKDRAAVIAQFKSYEAIFEQLTSRREQLLSQIENLKVQIETLDGQLQGVADEANRLAAEIRSLRSAGRTEESNQLVPAQNQAAAQAQSLVNRINSLIVRHNQLVEETNQLAIEQQDLLNSLNANQSSPQSQN